jgi:hypothetical protein
VVHSNLTSLKNNSVPIIQNDVTKQEPQPQYRISTSRTRGVLGESDVAAKFIGQARIQKA